MRILKQRNIGTFLGIAKILVGQITPYINWVSLALVGIMSFYTTLNPLFASWGIQLSFWMFIIFLAIVIIGIAVIEWIFLLPSYFGASNVQSWESENPQRAKLENIEHEVKEIKRMMEGMLKEKSG